MGRPKSTVERKTISTTLKIEILDEVKRISEKEGIPMNRLIEVSLEKYLKTTRIEMEG